MKNVQVKLSSRGQVSRFGVGSDGVTLIKKKLTKLKHDINILKIHHTLEASIDMLMLKASYFTVRKQMNMYDFFGVVARRKCLF